MTSASARLSHAGGKRTFTVKRLAGMVSAWAILPKRQHPARPARHHAPTYCERMKTSTYVPTENLVDLLLDAICVVDKRGRFVFVSAACQRIFGYSADEMIGKVMIEMVHPEDRTKTLQAALYGISEAAHSAKDLLGLFQQVHQIVGELLPTISFSVALYDEQNDELSFPYPAEQPPATTADTPQNAATLSAQVIRSGNTLLLSDSSQTQPAAPHRD